MFLTIAWRNSICFLLFSSVANPTTSTLDSFYFFLPRTHKDARGEDIGTVAGGMTTSTANTTAVNMSRAARREDEGGSGRVALFRGRPDGVWAMKAPDRVTGERMRF